MASPTITNDVLIETSKLFIDSVEIKVYPGNIRREHGEEGKGYQRDPYKRIKWLTTRSKKFKRSLLRTIEVSPRQDGTYAIIDGGGRWVMAQLAKEANVHCRVHHGLTRAQEAQLFYEFDREIYRLRGIDGFLALMSAGDGVANSIARAVHPYVVAISGPGTLRCVGQFMSVKETPHWQRVLSTTSELIAKHWGGYDDKAQAFPRKSQSIDGLLFMAVALVVDAVNEAIEDEGWDASAAKDYKTYLGKVLSKVSTDDVLDALPRDGHGKLTEKTKPATLTAAKWLARRTRVHAIKDGNETLSDGMLNGRLYDAYNEPRTYSARVEAERKAQAEATVSGKSKTKAKTKVEVSEDLHV